MLDEASRETRRDKASGVGPETCHWHPLPTHWCHMLTGSWDKQLAPQGRGAESPWSCSGPSSSGSAWACRKPRAPGLDVPARAKAALSSLQRCKAWRAAGGPRRWQWQLRPGVPGVQASPTRLHPPLQRSPGAMGPLCFPASPP